MPEDNTRNFHTFPHLFAHTKGETYLVRVALPALTDLMVDIRLLDVFALMS